MAKRKKKAHNHAKVNTGKYTANINSRSSKADASASVQNVVSQDAAFVQNENTTEHGPASVHNEDKQVQETAPIQNEINQKAASVQHEGSQEADSEKNKSAQEIESIQDENNPGADSVQNESKSDQDFVSAQNEDMKDKDAVSDPDDVNPDEAATEQENDEDGDVTAVETWIDKSEVPEEAKKQQSSNKRRKRLIFKTLRILCTIGFFVFTGLFINEVFILPYRMNKSIEEAQSLYRRPVISDSTDEAATPIPEGPDEEDDAEEDDTEEDVSLIDEDAADNEDAVNEDTEPDKPKEPTPTPDPTRDSKGRLLAFTNLLRVNEDVKGWLTINNINGENDTKIDLVVMQSGADEPDPEFYLYREWSSKEQLKSGSLILDVRSSVEKRTKNYVIHGHNMKSTDSMFHHLVDYKEKKFLIEHPIINFDTIYETGLWKVFSVFITPGNDDKGDFFDYMKSTFRNDMDYMNFIYQLRIRSIYQIDDVDINENDQILTLSTCSYELRNYRTIVVARKVREGEDPTVDTDSIKIKKKPLYPESYFKHYGGSAPDLAPDFQTALENGEISWYKPVE
jgi:sortase B